MARVGFRVRVRVGVRVRVWVGVRVRVRVGVRVRVRVLTGYSRRGKPCIIESSPILKLQKLIGNDLKKSEQ